MTYPLSRITMISSLYGNWDVRIIKVTIAEPYYISNFWTVFNVYDEKYMKSWRGVIGFLNMCLLALVMYSALSSMHMFIHDSYQMTTNVFAFIFSSQVRISDDVQRIFQQTKWSEALFCNTGFLSSSYSLDKPSQMETAQGICPWTHGRFDSWRKEGHH